jgi:hypothetical protein
MTEITEIGKCSGCSVMSRLVAHACSACRERFGERCGILFTRIRDDKRFAIRFYRDLGNDTQRAAFRELFGETFMDYAAAETGAANSPEVTRVSQLRLV